jgi:N-methylhydantoinase B
MAESQRLSIEPYMMMILSKRLEAIGREMTNTTLRAARSGVMNMARDFSCSIVTGDGRLLYIVEGLPVPTPTTRSRARWSCLERTSTRAMPS